MTDDYTPTTDGVRAAYSQARCEFDPDAPEVEDTDTEFNRWLDREIAHAVAAEREAIAARLERERAAVVECDNCDGVLDMNMVLRDWFNDSESWCFMCCNPDGTRKPLDQWGSVKVYTSAARLIRDGEHHKEAANG